MPQTLVNQACLDIQSGRADLVLIAGAETFRTRTRLRNRGVKPDWTSEDESVPFAEGANEGEPLVGPGGDAASTSIRAPYFYAMFEQALRIKAGESSERAPQAYRRTVVAVQRRRRGQPARLEPKSVVRRRDLAAERRQPDDQLALHEADELQQHGRSGRG